MYLIIYNTENIAAKLFIYNFAESFSEWGAY
jgi:hypothetical protein